MNLVKTAVIATIFYLAKFTEGFADRQSGTSVTSNQGLQTQE